MQVSLPNLSGDPGHVAAVGLGICTLHSDSVVTSEGQPIALPLA